MTPTSVSISMIESKDAAADVLATYRATRARMSALQDDLLKQIPRKEGLRIASETGVPRGATPTADDEALATVLLDFAIYQPREGGLSIVHRRARLRTAKLPENDPERIVLEAMARSGFSLFKIVELRPGLGALMRDVISDRTSLMIDVNLSKSLATDVVLATRMIDHGPFWTTTGASMVASDRLQEATERVIVKIREVGAGPDALLDPECQRLIQSFALAEYLNRQTGTVVRYL